MKQRQDIDLYGFKSILETYCFFGVTAKRNNDSTVIYTYKSFKYSGIVIKALVRKTSTSKIPSPKVVAFVSINNEKFITWGDFITKLKALTKYVTKENKYGNNCRRPCPNSSKHDAKRFQVVRKDSQKRATQTNRLSDQ